MSFDVKSEALAILERQIEGVESLKRIVDDNLEEIARRVAECRGSVVISGVGKSGHIGKKISSTISSIGIRSFFLHPTEALHGDLGMLSKEDLIIMISNSGETKEFVGLLEFTKANKFVTIAVTRAEFSTLANSCTYKVVMPAVSEVVGYGAPTTSTTQTLVIGDVIGVLASKLRGFGREDYARIHPGGKLGLSLTHVSSVMRRLEDTPVVDINSSIIDAIKKSDEHRFGFACIAGGDGVLKGIITDGDVRRGIIKYGDFLNRKLAEVSTKNPVTINSADTLVRAIELFNEVKINVLIVVDEAGKIMGSLDRKDINI